MRTFTDATTRLVQLTKTLLWCLRFGSSFGRAAMMGTYLRVEVKALLAHCLGISWRSETVWGQTLQSPSYEMFAILFEELYVPDIYGFHSANGQPRIIDCGANIGAGVAYFLTKHPNARIQAFEADEGTFQVLAKNHGVNGWRNVTLHHAAVDRSEEPLTFFSRSTAPLASSFRRSISVSEPTETVTIKPVRLSSYIDGPVDLLKLDIEGSEIGVLEDLAETGTLSFIGQIIAEYHHHIEPDEDRLGHFLTLLEQNGFGYELRAPLILPFATGRPQNFILYAYRKQALRSRH